MTPLVFPMRLKPKLHIAGRMIVMAYARTGMAFGMPSLYGRGLILFGMI